MRTCGAKTRAGKVCQGQAMANGRCRMHGGSTPQGMASVHYKHGRYSKALAGTLLDRFEQSLNDPDLLALEAEIALVDALTEAHTEVLGNPEATDRSRAAAESRALQLIEQRRKLTASEADRRVQMSLMVPVGEVVSTAAALLTVVREEVDDLETFNRIAAHFDRLVGLVR